MRLSVAAKTLNTCDHVRGIGGVFTQSVRGYDTHQDKGIPTLNSVNSILACT
jgi:hypothetical protein